MYLMAHLSSGYNNEKSLMNLLISDKMRFLTLLTKFDKYF